jgi:hypothetical protein
VDRIGTGNYERQLTDQRPKAEALEYPGSKGELLRCFFGVAWIGSGLAITKTAHRDGSESFFERKNRE